MLGVIPARGGSKGIPRKNIRVLAGKPLLQYSVEAAKHSRLLDRLVVSTEDAEIAEMAESLGVEVVNRPSSLAGDDVPMWPVVQHALDAAEDEEQFDAVFTLQVTTPLRTGADIDDAIRLLQTSGADSVIGVVRVLDSHPARAKRIEDGRLRDFCVPEPEGVRRQDLTPTAYLRNGAVYVTRRDTIISGSIRGTHQCPLLMPPERSVNIDEPLDLLLAEALLQKESAALP